MSLPSPLCVHSRAALAGQQAEQTAAIAKCFLRDKVPPLTVFVMELHIYTALVALTGVTHDKPPLIAARSRWNTIQCHVAV